jgi:hypothetical protein
MLMEKRMLWLYTPALLLIKGYLFNRTQMVFFKGSASNIIHEESGIPQGRCLGPFTFFNLY